MKNDQESIKRMIHDTVSLLCRNSVSHGVEVRIQGLIGITVDDDEVFLVHLDESYRNERSRLQNKDGTSSTDAGVAEPPKYNPRERAAAATVTSCSTAAGEESDSDVIFIADELSDSDVKLEFDQFCGSADNASNNYAQQMSNNQLFKSEDAFNNQLFKSEDTFSATDLNNDVSKVESQSSHVTHRSGRNVLLRNMLAEQSSYTMDQSSGWPSESVSYEETTIQTSSVRHEQTMTRPRVKQVHCRFH